MDSEGISMPPGFRYREIYAHGKPDHPGTDPFRAKHPGMDVGKRAKIFAPFDALRGFGEALLSIEAEAAARERGARCGGESSGEMPGEGAGIPGEMSGDGAESSGAPVRYAETDPEADHRADLRA